MDDEPIRFRNYYRCDDCDVEWSDDWSCCCDDECPSCGRDYTPTHSEDLEEETF